MRPSHPVAPAGGLGVPLEQYRIPRREVQARILLDDGRTLEGTVFTTESGGGARPENVLHLLNDASEDFVPLVCGKDSFLLNKAGIIWVQLSGRSAEEVAEQAEAGRPAPVRLSLAGGLSLVGTLSIVMPRTVALWPAGVRCGLD